MNTIYINWLNSITLPLLQEGTPMVLPDELEIQSLWYQGAFGLDFTTTEGKPVKIDYLGEWNHAAGPDFLECLVTIDGVEKKGALEIDLSPVHWELHGHAVNPSFNKVVLHVSFSPSHATCFCRTSENKDVPQVSVPIEKIEEGLGAYPDNISDTLPGFCAEQFQEWNKEEIITLLAYAARHRLSLKAQKVSAQISAIGLRETLWQSLAATLGYRPNQKAMRLLSQRVKYSQIQCLKEEHERVSVLLGMADFISPSQYLTAPEETQSYLQDLWKTWWKHRKNMELSPERKIPWQKGGQRPVNHPHRRVASLAALSSGIPYLVKGMKSPTPDKFKVLKKKLLSIEDPFWSHHYTLTSARSKVKLKLLGEEKFHELLVNFLIPLWYLSEPEKAFRYYTTLKGSSKNTQVKRTLGRLFPNHPYYEDISRLKFQHQGLQQLYQDFCLRSGCLHCKFPKLTQYDHIHAGSPES